MQQTLSLLTIYQVPSLTKQSKQIDTRGISTITIIIATITIYYFRGKDLSEVKDVCPTRSCKLL